MHQCFFFFWKLRFTPWMSVAVEGGLSLRVSVSQVKGGANYVLYTGSTPLKLFFLAQRLLDLRGSRCMLVINPLVDTVMKNKTKQNKNKTKQKTKQNKTNKQKTKQKKPKNNVLFVGLVLNSQGCAWANQHDQWHLLHGLLTNNYTC